MPDVSGPGDSTPGAYPHLPPHGRVGRIGVPNGSRGCAGAWAANGSPVGWGFMVGNPFFGRMSDRTASPLGMRRPWMVTGLAGGSLGVLMVALAPSIPVVLAGWCIAQLFFNALLAAMVAVLRVCVEKPRLVREHRPGRDREG